MTVKELIKVLGKYNPEAQMFVATFIQETTLSVIRPIDDMNEIEGNAKKKDRCHLVIDINLGDINKEWLSLSYCHTKEAPQ